MSDKLEFTGERFTPECVREIRYEHLHRYVFAADFCHGKTVLDAACGEGYGADLLARSARSVTGVDRAAEAIEHARKRYQRANLDFEVADVTQLPMADDSFDRVVSFETLEHLAEQEALLREFRRVLKPDGLLILSSPDKAIYSDQHGFDNEYHVRELYTHELEQLLDGCFPAFRLLGQKLMFHSVIWDASAPPERVRACTMKSGGSLAEGSVAGAAVYLIALCAARESDLPDVHGRLWLFDDEDETVYSHYYHEIRKNMAAGAVLAEREAELADLRRRVGRGRWWRRWFGRD